jgi:hypothetical protein
LNTERQVVAVMMSTKKGSGGGSREKRGRENAILFNCNVQKKKI